MLILALLALWVQVVVPQGFMLAASGSGPALVICTGHGPLTLDARDHSGKAPPSKSDMPCVFAGHGLADASATPVRLAAPTLQYAEQIPTQTPQVVPGRGLAAPPPPARGPPLV